MLKLIIEHEGVSYIPIVEDGVKWDTERKGSPGKLTFKVIKDMKLNFSEGDVVKFYVDDTPVFFGFVFTKKRDKEHHIEVVAYDQLRYFKNKDTINFENCSASDVLREIIGRFGLSAGSIDETNFKYVSRLEDDKTMFDMVQNALDETLMNDRKLYVLYDDFGKICLRDIENMKLNVVINQNNAENFDYSSSIDNTYNQIKLAYDNEESKKREIYITKHTENINRWGLLQYFEKLNNKLNGVQKAETLLTLYNRKQRNLSISNAFGDVRVRAGTSVIINLNLGDIEQNSYMVVESASHTFNKDEHMMNLTLRGSDFVV